MTDYGLFLEYIKSHEIELFETLNGRFIFCSGNTTKCHNCIVYIKCTDNDTHHKPQISDFELELAKKNFPEYFV